MNNSLLTTTAACPHLPFIQISSNLRIFFATMIFLVSTIGTLANLLLFLTILINHKHFLKFEIYPITLSMSIVCPLYFLANFLVAIPVVLNQYTFLENLDVMKTLAAINTFTYYLEQSFLLIIALNRFLLLCTGLKDYYLKRVTKILHGVAWIYGFLLTLIPSFLGCFKVFTPRTLTFTFGCGSCGGAENTYVIAGEVAPLTMLFLYACIIFRLHYVKHRAAREYSLTIQCLVICSFSWSSSFAFFFFPKWFPGQFGVNVLSVMISCSAMSANPAVLIIFNEKIRSAARTIILRKRKLDSWQNIRRTTVSTINIKPATPTTC